MRITTKAAGMAGWKRAGMASLAAMGAVLVFSGCEERPVTQSYRVNANADDEVEGTGIGSADIIACADKWVPKIIDSVYEYDWAEAPFVAMLPAENRTTQQFDGKLITNKIRTNLMNGSKGKLRFVSRDNMDSILAERERKREGVVSSGAKKAIKGIDYYVTLSISSSTARRGGDESNYVLMTAEMTDMETGEIIWTDDYEFKKVGQRGATYR